MNFLLGEKECIFFQLQCKKIFMNVLILFILMMYFGNIDQDHQTDPIILALTKLYYGHTLAGLTKYGAQ